MLITSKPTIDVKADIWNMPQLSHLRTNKRAKLPPPTTSTSSTNSYLQTLSLVAPESCKEDVLAKAGERSSGPKIERKCIHGEVLKDGDGRRVSRHDDALGVSVHLITGSSNETCH
ncbi:hypothetical protein FXO37_00952 [Capsicum annuum]|nr:hypothetical protein FXO37_00952 [Capsicum annuum]